MLSSPFHRKTLSPIFEEYFSLCILHYYEGLLEKIKEDICTNPKIILLYPNPSPFGPNAYVIPK
jgi:hypothetical protein